MNNSTSPRNPVIPTVFVRQMDPTTGEGTDLYWGPSSKDDTIQVYILDLGHGQPLRVEYYISGPYTDVDYRDAEGIAEEIYDFITQWNADTIFGSNGDLSEVAA